VETIAPIIPGKKGDPGRSGEDNRLFLQAVLWIARTGSPWRDLPPYFGKWFSVWKRICERLGMKFPGPPRQKEIYSPSSQL